MADDDELHWFRRLLLFVLGGALFAGGCAYVYFVLLPARVFSLTLTIAAGFMVAIGGAILWADIVGPILRALRRRFVAPRTPEPLKPERGRKDEIR